MKKFFAILLAVCLLASTFGIGAFAAEATAGLENFDTPEVSKDVVLQIRALLTDGTVIDVGNHISFEAGWNAAMGLALNKESLAQQKIDRVIVDFHADWIAENGRFPISWEKGVGFSYSTILIPAETKVTLNLNGHTLNRDLDRIYNNGEVICIADRADVIINNGTIKGGASMFSAGGIYIQDDAKVTLNDVHLTNNYTEWNGGAIAVNDGSTLVMNGGSLKNNSTVLVDAFYDTYGGAVYVEDATAVFNNVEFNGNQAPKLDARGAAIYADNADITINGCIFEGNGVKTATDDATESVILALDSSIKVMGSVFTGNGGEVLDAEDCDYSAIFVLEESKLSIDTSEFRDNLSYFIINDEDESEIRVSNTKFIGNKSAILRGDSDTSIDSCFTMCVFENNGTYENTGFYEIVTFLTFYNCSIGNTKFADMRYIKFVDNVPESDVVLSVNALKKNGETEFIADYNNFEIGWNSVMALAINSEFMATKGYDRLVVDIHANWYSKDGQFTEAFNNGVGFNWDAIYIQPGTRITLNLNGNLIDRGLTGSEENGEVICIGNGADVIINEGTISGGWSRNGAGGIHIHDKSNVTLNNVNLIGNTTTSDDGAGIAVYDGSTLTVNGGIFEDNFLKTGVGAVSFYGTVYVEDSTAVFHNVTFKHNGSDFGKNCGAAIYSQDSHVTINKCTFDGNGVIDEAYDFDTAYSTLSFDDSEVTVTDSTFINDGSEYLICIYDSTVTMDNCVFTKNQNRWMLHLNTSAIFTVTNTQFVDNSAGVLNDSFGNTDGNTFKKCTFNNNVNKLESFAFAVSNIVIFEECDLGDSNFSDPDDVSLVGTEAPAGFHTHEGSIFGEGSLAMIVALTALVASGASIGISFVLYKKKENVQTK